MAGITGMGDSFTLPNYAGELFALTPEDTPFLSAIGGLTGGGMTSGVEFEWSTYDLRDPSQRTRTEGATAPTAEERARAGARNVLQIHQEKVSVSYTKQAAIGQLATPQAAPFRGAAGDNAVTNELNWQTVQALKSIALDVNWSFLNGTFSNPTTNATARRTRGLLTAIQSNRVTKGTSITGLTSATDTISETATARANGDKIVFTTVGVATGIVPGRTYYVVSKATDSFKVATSAGGAAITLGTATGIAYTVPSTSTLAKADVNGMLQLAYDNGGISEQATATLLCNSSQKMALTNAYTTGNNYQELSRTIGGVNVTTIITDFGTLNVMLDRHMPQDTIAAVSMEQCTPVFLNVPGKGTFFEEALAKTGASDEVQLYGEIGLKYGNERAHSVMTGLKV